MTVRLWSLGESRDGCEVWLVSAFNLTTWDGQSKTAWTAANMNDDDSNFRERFDTLATYVLLAILALASATWIEAAIRRLYY